MEPALKQWFLHHGDRQEGPLTQAEIKRRFVSGELGPDAHAWCEGMPDWQRVAEMDAFRPAQPPPMKHRPLQAVSKPANDELSALIEVPLRKEEPTLYLEGRALRKVKSEIRRAGGGLNRMFWAALIALLLTLSAFLVLSHSAHADNNPQTSPTSPQGERMNVEAFKHKYWAQGEEEELRVVQNRRYSKADSFELGLMGGFVSSDPFLNIHSVGASLGYYLSENFEVAALGWKYFSGNSSAMDTLQQTKNTTADTNPPHYFIGADAKWSPLYGKLSLLGQKIIYYDIYLIGGGGETSTQSGTDLTPLLGIGSQIYLTRSMLLQLTYYQMVYNETVLSATTGLPATTRTSWTSNVTLGLNFLLF